MLPSLARQDCRRTGLRRNGNSHRNIHVHRGVSRMANAAAGPQWYGPRWHGPASAPSFIARREPVVPTTSLDATVVIRKDPCSSPPIILPVGALSVLEIISSTSIKLSVGVLSALIIIPLVSIKLTVGGLPTLGSRLPCNRLVYDVISRPAPDHDRRAI